MTDQVDETIKFRKKNSVTFKQEDHIKQLEDDGLVNHGYDHCNHSEPKNNVGFEEKVNVILPTGKKKFK